MRTAHLIKMTGAVYRAIWEHYSNFFTAAVNVEEVLPPHMRTRLLNCYFRDQKVWILRLLWFKNIDMNVPEWQSRSPDKNPIENLSEELKTQNNDG